jgi:hypothetical protein
MPRLDGSRSRFARFAGVGGVTSLLALAAVPAQAGLIQAGATVQALYYDGSTASGNTENESTSGGPGPVSLASGGVTFLAGGISGSTVQITDTQIIITNTLTGANLVPYCTNGSQGTSCIDQISGFGIVFAGENITGVTVNAAGTDASMTPVVGTAPPYSFAHHGLQLLSANSVLVDLTGALPAGTQTLTIDVTTAALNTPEPASIAMLGVGLLGLAVVSRQRRSPL